MIINLGNYYLKQPIDEAKNLVEFTSEEYANFAIAGIPRMLQNEKIYNAPDMNLFDEKWNLIIAVTNSLIYKISVQLFTNDKNLANSQFQKALDYLTETMGKHNDHSFLSKRYFWDSEDGNVILDKVNQSGFFGVNLFLTSSIIRGQMQYLV